MTNQFSVTGVGVAVVDYVGVVEKFPLQDTQVELKTFSKQTGGNAATAMVTLARLGAKASFLGKLGDDELGKMVHADLTANGVDLSGSVLEPGGSMGFAFIIVEAGTGRRTILWTGEGRSHLSAHELDRETILSNRYLHLDHYSMDAAIAAARIAREGDVQVVLDAEDVHPGIDELLSMVDVLITCENFAYKYTGTDNCEDALAVLFDRTPAHTVAITAGEDGSYCRNAVETHRQMAFPVDAIDTTGCGDVYHGAFIFGLMQNWPLTRVAEFSSAAAAINCRGLGAQSGIPNYQEVMDFLTHNKSGGDNS